MSIHGLIANDNSRIQDEYETEKRLGYTNSIKDRLIVLQNWMG